MNGLGLDTSAGACSAAVLGTDGLLAQRLQVRERGHAEALLPLVRGALDDAACPFEALSFLSVTVGPGAFTGLRIGLATARGIALAAGIPCFGVSTLQAIAAGVDWSHADDRVVLVAMDTRRGDVYVQPYLRGRAVAAPVPCALHALAAEYAGRAVALAGDGASMVADALRPTGSDILSLDVPPYPTAAAVVTLAARRWAAGERPMQPPLPVYLRDPAIGPHPAHVNPAGLPPQCTQ